MAGGCHSHRLYSHSYDCKVKTLTSVLTVEYTDFLGFDRWLRWIEYAHIYRSIRKNSDSTPSLVYGLTIAVTAVTIESMGVTPPELLDYIVHKRLVTPCSIYTLNCILTTWPNEMVVLYHLTNAENTPCLLCDPSLIWHPWKSHFIDVEQAYLPPCLHTLQYVISYQGFLVSAQ